MKSRAEAEDRGAGYHAVRLFDAEDEQIDERLIFPERPSGELCVRPGRLVG